MDLTQAISLNNDVDMPLLGLGTWQSNAGDEVQTAVQAALDTGYRHIDTAKIYQNEASIGDAIQAHDIPAEDIFVTTKLWNDDQGYDSALRAFDESQQRLGIDPIDLYLIHWPKPKANRQESWRALERLYDEGRVRAIGVSNYMTHHLQEVLANANVPPAVNQIELHPFNFATRQDTVELCRKHDIAITAYSPLAQAEHMDDTALVELSEKYERTPAQVMLRWLVQQGIIVIPKSTNPSRIQENSQIFDFELGAADMERLRGLNQNEVVTMDPQQMP